MKKQILILPIAIIVLTVLTLTSVSAAVGLTLPVEGGNYTTTMTFTCTTPLADLNLTVNASLLYAAAGGSAQLGTGIILDTIENTSVHQTTFTNAAVSLTGLSDLATYNFTCYACNESNGVCKYSVAAERVTIDNTDCVATTTIDATKVEYGRLFEWTTNITDATSGLKTSSCQILNPDSKWAGTVSTSDTSVLFDETTRLVGIYNLSCNATDYSANTCSSSDLIEVLAAGRVITTKEREIPIIGDILEKLKGMDKKTAALLIGVIVLLILASKKWK